MPRSSARIALSEHTLTVNHRKCDLNSFDFSEIEEYVKALTGSRQYQFEAIKDIMVYLWGGRYQTVVDLAKDNYKTKEAIQQRFHSEEHFLKLLPLPDKLSGVCHLATGTGKSYIMFAVAYLSLLLGKTKRVLVLGPSSTIIEQGLKEKFQEYMYGEKGIWLKQFLPAKYHNISVNLLNCNQPITDYSIVIENINAIFNKDRNAIGDTLFSQIEEVLVLSDEVHHAYSHLDFSGQKIDYNFNANKLGTVETRNERLWMKFLREEKKITKHIGFTGTPYNQDDYFVDVLYNYSIKDASMEKYIKKIDAILKTTSDEGETELTTYQKYEQILDTHFQNIKKYSYPHKGKAQVKPITIFINKDQKSAQRNASEFVKVYGDYLANKFSKYSSLSISEREVIANRKVICVITNLSSKEYQDKLNEIEQTDPSKTGGEVEFIFAVNKLSEGWDVDNVFQIVPMEEKVFNSKLLISQVIGRGLRIPRKPSSADIQGQYPVVTITNHEKFANHIKELLDEVTECDLKFVSTVLKDTEQPRAKYNFNVFNINYVPAQRVIEKDPKEAEPTISKQLILTPSTEKLGLKVTYIEGNREFKLTKEFFTFDQIVLEIERRYQNTVFEREHFDFGDGFVIDNVPERSDIEKVIKTAMGKAGVVDNKISVENKKQIELFFNQYLPRGKKKVIRENIEGHLFGISSLQMRQSSASIGGIDSYSSVFFSEDYDTELSPDNLFILEELKKAEKKNKHHADQLFLMDTNELINFNDSHISNFIKNKNIFSVNRSLFKTPQSLIILSHKPERVFALKLIEHSKFLGSWIKSPDMSFYSIEYEYWKAGKDRVRRSFNPDFFIEIKIRDYMNIIDGSNVAKEKLRQLENKGYESIICSIEIKGEDDFEEVTKAKEKYGIEHFQSLNNKLKDTNPVDLEEEYRNDTNQYYVFYLLRPEQFDEWFGKLKSGGIIY